MLVAQLTDIHIGFDPDAKPEELNVTRVRAVLARMLAAPNQPELIFLTGDLTDHGRAESYDQLKELFAEVPLSVYPAMGNHDDRVSLRRAFPDLSCENDEFIHYAVERDGLRMIVLDTSEPDRHGGAFCEARKRWLSTQLAAHPGTPTIIFMHHPPVVAGIGWMDPNEEEGWIERFGEAVAGHDQIRWIHCGHVHRQINTTFCGIPLSVTPSIAPPVAMDLRPISPDMIDGRNLITSEAPGYAMHRWENGSLVSHYEYVDDWDVLAAYTPALQPMIRDMFAERNFKTKQAARPTV